MARSRPLVLMVEDEPALATVYQEMLSDTEAEVSHVETGAAALAEVDRRPPDAILLDVRLPDTDGVTLLRTWREKGVDCPIVIMTAHGSVKLAVEAMKTGAYDFLAKPFSPERLRVTLRNALEHGRLRTMVETIRAELGRSGMGGMVGASLPMQAVYRIIESAAPSRATVFITGESGTGKELCAEAIHRASPRAGGPFVPINCGAVPRDLIESEIFGHAKGAFTGATADRAGAAARAGGGTLFLDEVCEMPADMQTKLLRFIQTGTVQRVGSDTVETVDVRFVCATNRDPWTEVEAGRFREDLYYRLHVIPIHLPPLRQREGDVVEIARVILAGAAREEGKAFTGLAPETEAALAAYPWPGNVRQLQNVLRNAVVLHDGPLVTPEMLPAPLNTARPAGTAPGAVPSRAREPLPDAAGAAPDTGGVTPLWRLEKEAIERAIALCEGNIPRAAALLEISPSTIYRKKQAWEE